MLPAQCEPVFCHAKMQLKGLFCVGGTERACIALTLAPPMWYASDRRWSHVEGAVKTTFILVSFERWIWPLITRSTLFWPRRTLFLLRKGRWYRHTFNRTSSRYRTSAVVWLNGYQERSNQCVNLVGWSAWKASQGVSALICACAPKTHLQTIVLKFCSP